MTLEEYLTPDPSLRPPAPSPEFIVATKVSRASRQISLHSKGSVRGFFVANGYQTWYESELERKVGFAFKARPDVVDVVDQPPAVPYIDEDGVERHHTFDWLVIKTDGSRYLVAVKPSGLVAKSGIQNIVDRIAQQVSAETADFVTLVTEKKLSRIDNFNGELIHSALRDDFPDDDAAIVALAKKLRGAATIESLVGESGLGGSGFRATVRAIARGELVLTDYRTIDYDAIVKRGARG
jgi:hypothetical protein